MMEKLIGYVSHPHVRRGPYAHIGVTAIELIDTLKVGDTICIRGTTTYFVQ